MSMVNGVVTVLPPPRGYQVDFDNPQREAETETYWVAGIGNFVALLFIGQRLYTKLAILHTFQAEDAFLVLAWITSIGTQAVILRMFDAGVVGVHAWEISLEQYNLYSILILLAPVIYAPCSAAAKLALLLFYRRIGPQTWFMWSIWATIVVVVGYSIGIFFSLIFACNPIARSWDITIQEGSCINRPALYIATAVLGIVTDVILLVLPLPLVIRLQVSIQQKLGLILMFAIGSMTFVTSIIRLIILLPVLTDMDQPWAIAFPCTWICVEANLLVICGALPTLRKFFRHVAPGLIGESASGQPAAHVPGNTNLRTFGSSGQKRRQYRRFEDTGSYALGTLPRDDHGADGAAARLRPDCTIETHAVAAAARDGGGGGGADDGHDGAGDYADNDSEKGIMRTKTTVISYSTASRSRQGTGSSGD